MCLWLRITMLGVTRRAYAALFAFLVFWWASRQKLDFRKRMRSGFGWVGEVHGECVPYSPSWQSVASERTTPSCIYVDLGAHHGDSYGAFIGSDDTDGKSGIFGRMFAGSSVAERKKCFVHLIEGNEMFKPYLYRAKVKSAIPSRVSLHVPSLVYTRDTVRRFYVNPGTKKSGCRDCGGALDPLHSSSRDSGIVKEVEALNLNRLLMENALAEDYVIIKVNIEGGEWPILPCLAQSPAAALIDELWVEVHTPDVSPTLAHGPGTPEYKALRASMQRIEDVGVSIHEFGASCLGPSTRSKWCNI